jgi:hypothetical protein
MSELPPSPPPAAPFESAPRPARSGGCGRPALIGCGVLLVLLGIGAVLVLIKAKDLLRWSLEKMKTEVVAKVPPDFGAEDRARLDRAFDAAAEQATSGQVDPLALQELQTEMMKLLQKGPGQVTRADLLALTEKLERMGKVEAPEEAEAGSGEGLEGATGAEGSGPPATPSP